jgi:hypothetical protein
MDEHDAIQTNEAAGPGNERRRQPGAFPPVGSAMTVKRRAYLLTDDEGRTWLALDPPTSSGGVMQPLVPGETPKIVAVEDDGVVLRVTSPSGMDSNVNAFLLPRRMVPPAVEEPRP